jgi:mitochondrial import inner membrane translocase subunit TIM21
VLSPNSHTAQFNRAVSRVKSSEACTALLGPPKSLVAFGESPWSSFRRARVPGPTPYILETRDPKTGIQEMKMRFLVRGSKDEGWVSLHMRWDKEELEYKYLLLALDVKGQRRVTLEGEQHVKRPSGNIFGLKWR